MAQPKHSEDQITSRKEIFKIVLICCAWYFISSSNNVITKTILTDFPYPMTISLIQFLSITVYSGPVFSVLKIRRVNEINWRYYLKYIVPLALGKVFASVSAHISMWKVSVSYSHTVKATLPMFTVILSRIILKEKQTCKVYTSLIPIVLGAVIASKTESSFNVIGLSSAILATMAFSLQSIFSKKVLHDISIHHMRLLHLLARLALVFFLPIWFIFDARKMQYDDHLIENTNYSMLLFLLFLDGFLNFAQNIVAFTMISLVTPLTYSVCNASKRIAVIIASIIMLKNPVSISNIFGMSVALAGVFMYNKAKYDANEEKKRKKVLPFTKSDSNLLQNYEFSNHVPYVHVPLPVNDISQNGNINTFMKKSSYSNSYREV